MTFDSKQQRWIMGHFATGVTVASTRVGDETWGMTANAVASLSLDPPLVLLAVQRGTLSHQKFQAADCYALNILTVDQQPLSNRFAFGEPRDFSGLDYVTAETGAPVLPDALGWVDCRIREVLAGGDHDIFIGEIVAGGASEDGIPLLYYSGKYAKLAN